MDPNSFQFIPWIPWIPWTTDMDHEASGPRAFSLGPRGSGLWTMDTMYTMNTMGHGPAMDHGPWIMDHASLTPWAMGHGPAMDHGPWIMHRVFHRFLGFH